MSSAAQASPGGVLLRQRAAPVSPSVQTRQANASSALDALLDPIRPDLQRVVCLLQDMSAKIDEPFRSRIAGLLCRGKRLRSALILLVGRVYGRQSSSFHSLAAAVEAVHTASLIHDDLLDGAARRRGQTTLHKAFSPKMAVLAGDYLLAQSMALVSALENPRVWGTLAAALGSVCAGEMGQMLSTGQQQCDRARYFGRIEAKTASLCATAVETAAILADAPAREVDALCEFGWSLGVAFQIVDDVLDLVGDEARLGKPAGGDLRQGVVTLPVINYLERTPDDTVVGSVLLGQRDAAHIGAALAAIRASGAIEETLLEARAYARRAQEALSILPDNASRQALCALAGYVVEREC